MRLRITALPNPIRRDSAANIIINYAAAVFSRDSESTSDRTSQTDICISAAAFRADRKMNVGVRILLDSEYKIQGIR